MFEFFVFQQASPIGKLEETDFTVVGFTLVFYPEQYFDILKWIVRNRQLPFFKEQLAKIFQCLIGYGLILTLNKLKGIFFTRMNFTA